MQVNQVVAVTVRSVYGRPMVYPANEAARLFARLVGAKTFTREQMELIRDLGHDIEHVPEWAAAVARAGAR